MKAALYARVSWKVLSPQVSISISDWDKRG